MYDKTETKLIEQIYTRPGIHKRELAKRLGLGMPSIDYALKKIESLLKKQRSGNQIKYYLDYSKAALTPFLDVVEFSRLERLPSKIKSSIRDFLKELPEKPLVAVLFGSYARGNYTSASDIDILLVFQKQGSHAQTERAAQKVGMRAGTKINPVYLDYSSFRSSFHDASKEFFRNLKENKIILIGTEYWRQLNEEA